MTIKDIYIDPPYSPNANLIMIASRWQWMCELLAGKEVSDFALSFPEVRQLDDIMRPWRDAAKMEAPNGKTAD